MRNEELLEFVRDITEMDHLAKLLKVEPLRIVSGDRWRLELLKSKPPFQVERATVIPNSVVPTHRHPHVDSFELFLAGDFEFYVGPRRFRINDRARSILLPVPHTAWHGGFTRSHGAVFLSMQQWAGGILGTVVDDVEFLDEFQSIVEAITG